MVYYENQDYINLPKNILFSKVIEIKQISSILGIFRIPKVLLSN